MDSVQNIKNDMAIAWQFFGFEGWTDTIFNHISVGLTAPGGEPRYVVNSWSQFAPDSTPEDFVLCNAKGPVDPQDAWRVNDAAINLHGSIQAFRAVGDGAVVIHLHSPAAMALAGTKEEILPVNQITMEFYEQVRYVDYCGVIDTVAEGQRIARLIGDRKMAILRNHGLLVVGASIQEAVYLAYYLERSCAIHLSVVHRRPDSVILPSVEVCRAAARELQASADKVADLFWQGVKRRVAHLNRQPASRGVALG